MTEREGLLSLDVPLLAYIFSLSHTPLLNFRLVDKYTLGLLDDSSFLSLVLQWHPAPLAQRLYRPLLKVLEQGNELTVSRAVLELLDPTKELDTPKSTSECPFSLPLRAATWLLTKLPLISLLLEGHWIDALKRCSVPPSERENPYYDSGWKYARKDGEGIPEFGSESWCKMLDTCTVRMGLFPVKMPVAEVKEPTGEEEEEEEETEETRMKRIALEKKNEEAWEKDLPLKYHSHLGGDWWPMDWTEEIEAPIDDETVAKVRILSEGIVPKNYYLVARLDLSDIHSEINRHWPLGGCPFPIPYDNPTDALYIFGTKEYSSWESMILKFYKGSSELVRLSKVQDFPLEQRRKLVSFLRKNIRVAVSRPIFLTFQVEVSVANFFKESFWTVREWLDEHEHYWPEQRRASSWMFGYLCTYNPERRSTKHSTLLQSWSMRKRGWKWGDLGALAISGKMEEGEAGFNIVD